MNRPPTKTLVMGHPVIVVPMTGLNVLLLLAGFQTGSVLPVVIAMAMIAAIHRASQQARTYRAWKADWDGMADGPAGRPASVGRFIGMLVVAACVLAGWAFWPQAVYAAGFGVGWLEAHPVYLTIPTAALCWIGFQFVRHWPRRSKPSRPVAVIARRLLPVPTMADTYRALPPYCQALLRGHP